MTADEARVLVALSVATANLGAPAQQPRYWRMRVTVSKVDGGGAKISKVDFVP
jgi:Mce-associated membrane protein